jgi:hypothetical protein
MDGTPMKLRRLALKAMLASSLAAAPALAHHSLAGVYGNRQATIEGRVAEFRFVNPHPILVVDVAAERAPAELWQLEMDNRFELSQIGIDAATWQPGDRVIARGRVARSEAQRLYLRRLERPADGIVYEQIGSTPRFGPGPSPPARREPGPPGR